MYRTGLFIFSLLAQIVAAFSSLDARAASPTIRGLGQGWLRKERPHSDVNITLELFMSAPDHAIEQAEKALERVSDPHSSSFSKYWTEEQISQHFSPATNIEHVLAELASVGVSRHQITISDSRSVLFLNTSVAEAERLFHAQYYAYVNGNSSQLFSDTFSMPANLSKFVEFVMPLRKTSPLLLSNPRASGALSVELLQTHQEAFNCSLYITPDCLRYLYNIKSIENEKMHPRSSLGIYEPAGATWLVEDMDAFFGRFEPSFVGKRPILQPVNGGYRQTDIKLPPFNLEPNLDFQYAMPLAHPVPSTNIQVGDKFLRGNLNTMLGAFDRQYCERAMDPTYDPIYPDSQNKGGYNSSDCGTQTAPLVISISYTQAEAQLPEKYLQLQCLEYLKLGLRGVTVLTASGDKGAAAHDTTCLDRNGKGNSTSTSQSRFSPNFPASCPWVTTVGGTKLSTQPKSGSSSSSPREETFYRLLADNKTVSSSGGGFSNVFPVPFYQQHDVFSYLHNSAQASHLQQLQHDKQFNAFGRGYPDVSALAANYLVYIDGALHKVHGTSAPTPVLASMIARINNARLNMGKGPVGFINPVLYTFKHKITRDVVDGFNQGCGKAQGFSATEGWDAATGLGSLDFTNLLQLYTELR